MHFCAECEESITDKFMLVALDKTWHEGCLRCVCCRCRLAEQGSHLYHRAGLILCARDYVRLYGLSGSCHLCSSRIAPDEWMMSAPFRGEKVLFHLECFACAKCNGRFCVGDPFLLTAEGRVLCQRHFD